MGPLGSVESVGVRWGPLGSVSLREGGNWWTTIHLTLQRLFPLCAKVKAAYSFGGKMHLCIFNLSQITPFLGIWNLLRKLLYLHFELVEA